MLGGRKWRTAEKSDLSWVVWEQDAVVYNASSGGTHLLNALAFEALLSLRDGPADAQELAGRMADIFDGVDRDELEERMNRLMAEFYEWGLAEPLRS